MTRTSKIQGLTLVILFENRELRARLREREGFGKMGVGDHKVKNKDPYSPWAAKGKCVIARPDPMGISSFCWKNLA